MKRKDLRGIHPDVLYDSNFWILESELPGTATEEEHLKAMLKRLAPKQQTIQKLAQSYAVELEIYGTKYDPHVGIFIENTNVAQLAGMGVGLGISIYSVNPSYLDTAEQVAILSARLKKLKEISTPQEAQAVAEALALFEDYSTDINSLISDLFWEGMDQDEQATTLKTIIEKLSKIDQTKKRSKLLSE